MTAQKPSGARRTGLSGRPRLWAALAAAFLLVDAAAVLGYLVLVNSRVPDLPDDGTWPVAVVFFADFADDGGLGPESLDRVDFAARLFGGGRVARLVCVGGRREEPESLGAERMAQALMSLGVPADRIVHDRNSFDTRSNWESASAILRENGWRETLLVSSALHLYRIAHLAAGPFDWDLAPTRPVFETLGRRPLGTVLDVHREWVAWLAMWTLPADSHRELVRGWRNFWHRLGGPAAINRTSRPSTA